MRDESARQTRRQIVEAARELFVERGFARCSVSDIAESAGVARPTVLSVFGSKAALLRAVVDQSMAGDDAPVPINDRPWMRPALTAPTQQGTLTAYAHVCLLICRRSAAVFDVVRRASDESDEIDALWRTLQHNRRLGAGTIVTRLRELGPLPSGLTAARAIDQLWMLNDPGLYTALVHDSGWSERAFERWLASAMTRSLLG